MSLASNIPEFTVGELAFAVKKSLEDQFGRVRVRGEFSRINIASSGHLYTSLKDDKGMIDAVCWKGKLNSLSVRPEEGMDVILTGKLSSFPNGSKYQIVIDTVELAGEGALLKLLEDRKKKLAAEGLFSKERKQALPFLPRRIGVVTSPTGAVIRDILHRLSDRFPRDVLVWGVPVQGQGADVKIAAAIDGFNALPAEQKPDLLIVARGGGSLEDLMPFNEEAVVRAVAASIIPVISAVGHETDTTLIDYAADLRAPTPTGAAEMAVPVRANLMAQVMDNDQRLFSALSRFTTEKRTQLDNAARGLGDPTRVLEYKAQACDALSDKLGSMFRDNISHKKIKFERIAAALRTPQDSVSRANERLKRWDEQLMHTPSQLLKRANERVTAIDKMLEAYSYHNVLQRGFAVVRDTNGAIVDTAKSAHTHTTLNVEFQDKTIKATTGNTPMQAQLL